VPVRCKLHQERQHYRKVILAYCAASNCHRANSQTAIVVHVVAARAISRAGLSRLYLRRVGSVSDHAAPLLPDLTLTALALEEL